MGEMNMGYILDLRKELGSRPLIMAGAGVIIINEKDEILLQKRADNGCWAYPAGSMELGESFEECARREVFEESGLVCGKLTHFTNYSGKSTNYKYPNGDEVYLASELFICRDYSGELKIQEEEVVAQRFFDIDDLPDNIAPVNYDLIMQVANMIRFSR